MTTQEILERLKPVAQGNWWCEGCGRFLNDSEVKYAMSGSYCPDHYKEDLSVCATNKAYSKVIKELVEELEYETNHD